jgi:hypothetical protein
MSAKTTGHCLTVAAGCARVRKRFSTAVNTSI